MFPFPILDLVHCMNQPHQAVGKRCRRRSGGPYDPIFSIVSANEIKTPMRPRNHGTDIAPFHARVFGVNQKCAASPQKF